MRYMDGIVGEVFDEDDMGTVEIEGGERRAGYFWVNVNRDGTGRELEGLGIFWLWTGFYGSGGDTTQSERVQWA